MIFQTYDRFNKTFRIYKMHLTFYERGSIIIDKFLLTIDGEIRRRS